MTGPAGDAGRATSQQLQEHFDRFQSRYPVRQVRAGTTVWEYLDAGGAGPVILILPGSTYRPDNYFQLIDDLAADHRILAPTYPPAHPLRAVAEGLAAVLDDAGVPATTVCGWSYGGYLAQAFTKLAPGRVRHLVLAQTGTRHVYGLTTMRVLAPVFACLPLGAKRAFTRRLWQRWFTAPSGGQEFWRDRLRQELQQISNTQHTAGVANMIDFMAHYRPAPGWLDPWAGGVLILQSAGDGAFSPARQAELRAAYPGATVQTVAGGHTALLTDTGWFTAQIRSFLR